MSGVYFWLAKLSGLGPEELVTISKLTFNKPDVSICTATRVQNSRTIHLVTINVTPCVANVRAWQRLAAFVSKKKGQVCTYCSRQSLTMTS